jgi:hypothetical protein
LRLRSTKATVVIATIITTAAIAMYSSVANPEPVLGIAEGEIVAVGVVVSVVVGVDDGVAVGLTAGEDV